MAPHFVLLMNDLPDCLMTCKTLMYADDTVIYCSSKNVQHIETVLTRELGLINNRLKDNSLFLNKAKTDCVLFGSRQRLSDVLTFTVSIDGFRIKHVTRYTYRIILKSSNSEQAMSPLAFDSLADRRDKHVLKFVKKCIKGKAPQYFLIILNQITILARE